MTSKDFLTASASDIIDKATHIEGSEDGIVYTLCIDQQSIDLIAPCSNLDIIAWLDTHGIKYDTDNLVSAYGQHEDAIDLYHLDKYMHDLDRANFLSEVIE